MADPIMVMRGIMFATVNLRKEELARYLFAESGGKVMAGAFKDMVLLEQRSWASNDSPAKIMGSYESDLHPYLDAMRNRPYSAIVNIGCAEGYYAIGLALRHPDIPVYAFDIDEKAQVICLEGAFANGVGDRMTIGGLCDPAALNALLEATEFPLLFLDCEAYETTLLNLETSPKLIKADFIVEAHDFIERSISQTLLQRFADTHDLHVVWDGPRNPHMIPALRLMSSIDAWLAVDEGRPETMCWIIGLRR